MTLAQLPLVSWLKIGLGLLIFVCPGYLLLRSILIKDNKSVFITFTVSFCLSISLWALLLSFCNLLKFRLLPLAVIIIFIFCGVIGLVRVKPWNSLHKINKENILDDLIFGCIFLIILITNLYLVRNEIAGLGSDSYHHTLITQLIIDQGKIPENYGTLYPIITFGYHYGFHATAAFLGWVSGIPTPLLILILGKIIILMCAISVGYAAEKMTGSRLAGLTAVVCTGIICVFPSYMLNWGRYTQLTGLTMMAIFIVQFWDWLVHGLSWKRIPLLVVLAIGIGLTHYRVIAMTVVGSIIIVIVYGIKSKIWSRDLVIKGAVIIISVALGLAPWLYHLWQNMNIGYPIITQEVTVDYYQVSRLGEEVINYPTNIFLIVIVGIICVIGCIVGARIVITMTTWSIVMLLPLNGLLFDTISVIISLYIPAGIILGWGAYQLGLLRFKHHTLGRLKNGILFGSMFVATILGINTQLTYPARGDSSLQSRDLSAIQFINTNLPKNAYFMVNMNRFTFSDILMICPDAGYWLPLLTSRRTVMPPMILSNERVNNINYAELLRKMESLNASLTSDEAINLLKQEGIMYVFSSFRKGPINYENLLASSSFSLIYNDGVNFIFEVIE